MEKKRKIQKKLNQTQGILGSKYLKIIAKQKKLIPFY